MQQSIFSQPVTWIILAVLSVYLFLLLRATFVFFFMGGRRKLLEQEKALSQQTVGENAPTPSPTPKAGIKALKMLA